MFEQIENDPHGFFIGNLIGVVDDDAFKVCGHSALANALMNDPDTLEEVAQTVAPQAMLDQTLVLRGARKVQQQIEDAQVRG